MKRSLILAAMVISGIEGWSQKAITAAKLDTSSTADNTLYNRTRAQGASNAAFSSSGNYVYKFGSTSGFSDNIKTLKSFTSDGSGYTYSSGINSVVKIRRVENASFNTYWSGYGTPQTTPTPRDLAYYESVNIGDSIKIKAPYMPKMEDLFQSNNIAVGIDNLFANDYITNFNNVERIDVTIPAGLTVQIPAAQGFAIFERGVYNQHDPSTLALITAIDGSGNPTAYATQVIRTTAADYYDNTFTENRVYQPSVVANGYWTILRRDSTNARLQASDRVSLSQGIGGVMIKFSDFGIAPGTVIYGYSILAGDFPTTGTGADVVDYTNSTYFPTNTSGSTSAGGNDMSVISGIVKILTISGKVFHDPNGLTNGVIDGNGIGKPSGTQLYVNLVDDNNTVVGVAAVDPVTGTYTFDKLAFGVITAKLSTTPGVIGQPAPLAGLPNGWSAVGENYGQNNLAGSGNRTGVSNAAIEVSMGDQNITGIHFGIEQTPVADAKSYSIPQPTSGQTITLNGSLAGTPNAPDQLTGSDPEDASGPMGLNGNTSNRTVVITALPANGQLKYNGVPVTPGQVIPNYDKSLLSLVLTGSGYNSVSFQYAFRDIAGAQSTPASYQVGWGSPLPVSYTSFKALAEGHSVRLDWSTASEWNNTGFTIERSNDSRSWSVLGFVPTKAENGNSAATIQYQANDEQPQTGINLYRLKQEDKDGKFTFSEVRQVVIDAAQTISIYPNPVTDKINFSISDGTPITEVRVYDMNGKVVLQTNAVHNSISMASMASGTYLVEVTQSNNKKTSIKVQKH